MRQQLERNQDIRRRHSNIKASAQLVQQGKWTEKPESKWTNMQLSTMECTDDDFKTERVGRKRQKEEERSQKEASWPGIIPLIGENK